MTSLISETNKFEKSCVASCTRSGYGFRLLLTNGRVRRDSIYTYAISNDARGPGARVGRAYSTSETESPVASVLTALLGPLRGTVLELEFGHDWHGWGSE